MSTVPTTIADLANGLDTPNFRTALRPLQRRLGVPVYHKDINAEWSVNSAKLVLYNTDAIKVQVMNVLGVLVGEEPGEPTFGSLLPYRLFETVGKTTAYLIEGDTIGALLSQMNGIITLVASQCTVTELDDGEGYAVQVAYYVTAGQPVEYLNFTFGKAGIRY